MQAVVAVVDNGKSCVIWRFVLDVKIVSVHLITELDQIPNERDSQTKHILPSNVIEVDNNTTTIYFVL